MSSIIFSLNNTEFSIPRLRKYLNKIPDDKEALYDELNLGKIYYVKSDVKNEIFESYLNYWKDGTTPELTSDNIWEYYQLSEEFGLLSEYISSKQFESLFNISSLINSTKNSNFDKSIIEKRIAHNLDKYLIQQPDMLSKIEITSLYNIFHHEERKLSDTDKAYEFIVNAAQKGNKSIFILLETLDAKTFKKQENVQNALFKMNEHHGFMPLNTNLFISDMESKMQNYEKVNQSNQQMEIEIKDLKEKLNSESDGNKELNSKLSNAEKEIKDLKEKLNSESDGNKDLNSKLSNAEKEIKDLNSKLSDAEKEIKDLKFQLNKAESMNKDLKSQTNEVQSLKDQLNKLKIENENLKAQINAKNPTTEKPTTNAKPTSTTTTKPTTSSSSTKSSMFNSSNNECKTIVIDCGTGITKAGFGGDESPRFVLPTVISYRNSNKNDYYIGDSALSKSTLPSFLLSHPFDDGVEIKWDYVDKIWSYIFNSKFSIDPSDYSILLTGGKVLNDRINRKKAIQMMFETYNVNSFYFGNPYVLSLYSSKRSTTGVVVDIGYNTTNVVPIKNGKPIDYAKIVSPLGGKHISDYLSSLIDSSFGLFSDEIKEKYAYVALDYNSELLKAQNSSSCIATFEKNGFRLQISEQRFRCAELLFKPYLDKQYNHKNPETDGIAKNTMDSILKCNVGDRKLMFSNIVLSGGTTMLNGLSNRLKNEIEILSRSVISPTIVTNNNRKYAAWIGGSILSTQLNFKNDFISRKDYKENGPGIVLKCI